MRLNFLVIHTIFSLTILSSCITISYSPKVSLEVAPRTIHKSIQIDKFVNQISERDRRSGQRKLSVTNQKALVSELGLEVANAIAADFAMNGVFKSAGRKVENPDFYLKGSIKKFKGEVHNNAY